MQRAACSRTSFSGSGRTNSCQCLIRSSTGAYLRSCRSISRKPVTLPILLRRLHGGGLFFCHLGERAAVFDRHHFLEQRTIALPIGRDSGRLEALSSAVQESDAGRIPPRARRDGKRKGRHHAGGGVVWVRSPASWKSNGTIANTRPSRSV